MIGSARATRVAAFHFSWRSSRLHSIKVYDKYRVGKAHVILRLEDTCCLVPVEPLAETLDEVCGSSSFSEAFDKDFEIADLRALRVSTESLL